MQKPVEIFERVKGASDPKQELYPFCFENVRYLKFGAKHYKPQEQIDLIQT